jgi:chemotaxis-related protein WspB
MQSIIWSVGSERYAIATEHVVEVVPCVSPRPLAHAMPWVKGLMNYRGRLIPLIDGTALLGQESVETRMHSRVLVLRLCENAQDGESVGLLVEQVIGVDNIDFDDDAAHPGLRLPDAEYLGPIASTKGGMVQLVAPDRMLSAEQMAVLFDRGSELES